MRRLVVAAAFVLLILAVPGAATLSPVRTLDGSGNNLAHPDWGAANTQYARVAAPNYANKAGAMVGGPDPRYVSNRVFNDVDPNLFSENGVSQWVWAWGQFIDHTIDLRDETPGESAPIPFDSTDPLESFTDDLGAIDFSRTPAAPGTGTKASPRQQINTVSSYIDGWSVYGGTNARLDWLRRGPVDGDPTDNGARLLLDHKYLPTVTARGDASTAPAMDLMGPLVGNPTAAVVAGDVRANENIALTAVHTLFAREHNRIVRLLPKTLSKEDRFQIARRVVGAEQQYITYTEFLPSVGVNLPPYQGYNPNVNASIANEFATVGYRAHSMIHGELDVTVPEGTYSSDQTNAFVAEGIVVADDGTTVDLTIPLNVMFGNPKLLHDVGLGPVLQALGVERQYKNDEQIDNSLRSTLFEIPKPGVDPSTCNEPVVNPDCFTDVTDLGAIDIQRGRDHGMPSYNDLREAYGLPRLNSFTDITGESTEQFPKHDPLIDKSDPIDDPNILDFVELLDDHGNVIPLGSPQAQEDAVVGIRRTTLAARLKAIYKNVNKLDAFVGMMSEQHVPGTEFGPLQLAIWTKQFAALRDGDRFFYLNDPVLTQIQQQYGIDYRQTLAGLIEANTGVNVQADVFKATDS